MLHPQSRRVFTLVFLLLAVGFEVAHALSSPPRPIRTLVHPTTRSLDILPRQQQPALSSLSRRTLDPYSTSLRHDDTFRLILTAFDEEFFLHLRPNDNLIHPAARIVHFQTDADGVSRESYTEPLLRESVKAYLGHVIDPEYTEYRLREDAARVTYSAYPESELGWARIMVHDQGDFAAGRAPVFEGAFTVDGVVHHVMTKDNYLRNKHPLDPEIAIPLDDFDSGLVIWRDSDIMSPEEEHLARHGAFDPSVFPIATKLASCGHDNLAYNQDPYQNAAIPHGHSTSTSPWFGISSNTSLFRRDDVAGGSMDTNYIDSIGDSSGCPTEQKVVYMGVAADCEYVSAYGGKENATQQILTNWNSASSTYKSTFNVSLGIVELQVQDATCPTSTNSSMAWNVACTDSITLNDRLSDFSQWRGQKTDSAGLWHLMSGCPTGSEVGIAWLGVLCQQDTTGSEGSFVSGTGVSTNGRTEWQIVAHEVGHNFGAIHDCADGCTLDGNCCPLSSSSCNADAKFIMSPVSQASENAFSQCSLGNICSVLGGTGGNVNTTCLIPASQATDTISLQMCGNGIVEDGEDCDPGSGVSSACCDSSTCKFTNGAVCDPDSSACCTGQCTFAPTSQVCRAAKDDKCDTAEMCTGSSSSCPEDKFSPNGQSCGSDSLACASGQCTSVSLQCKTVGASMNLTQACSKSLDSSCQITCQDPTSSNQCVQLNSLLVDGSPCGYGGTCSSGTCKSGSALDTAKAWYKQNLQIAIPVTIVVGIIILVILFYIVRGLFRCMGGRRAAPVTPMVVAGPGVNPSYSRLRHERVESYDRAADRAIPTYMTTLHKLCALALVPVVTLDGATVTGSVSDSGEVHQFLGIPFAKPPIGPLRFNRPVPVDAYSGTLNATVFGPACPQQSGSPPDLSGLPDETLQFLVLTSSLVGQEDCLSINVVKPINVTMNASLPVVAWIYGGGFQMGASLAYDGSVMVERSIAMDEPMIFVSMNYRVSAFGFLPGQEVKDAGVGNLGLLDQRLALEWIQRYIANFGGDPTKVTIWGESAGSISVGFQLLMNEGDTEGLFRGAFSNRDLFSPLGALRTGRNVHYDAIVENTDCAQANNTLECLRGVPYDTLKTAVDEHTPFLWDYQSLNLAYLPRMDGTVFPEDPMHLVSLGKVANITVVIGDCDDEGTMFALSSRNVTTGSEMKAYLNHTLFPQLPEDAVDTLLELYPSTPSEGSPFDTGDANALTPQYKRIASILGDYVFQAPRRFLLSVLAARATYPVYSFRSTREKAVPYIGAFHGSDIFTSTGGDMADYLIRFVGHLDPNPTSESYTTNGTDTVVWPEWSESGGHPKMLSFDDGDIPVSIAEDTCRQAAIAGLNQIFYEYLE